MNESDAKFWLKLLGGLLLVSALVIIYLGSYLFEQSTNLAHAGKDLNQAKAEREVLATLLAELQPQVSEAEARAVAERSGLSYRFVGAGESRQMIVEGLVFAVRDGAVQLDLDPP